MVDLDTIILSLGPAAIAAGVSVLSLIYSNNAKHGEKRNLEDINRLRDEVISARQDYEYEGRKRLFQELGPILFQFNERAQLAEGRIIRTLIIMSRKDHSNIDYSDSKIPSRFVFSSLYRLLAPLALFKILQARLSLLELELDSLFTAEYLIIKALYNTFSHDQQLAQIPPAIEYDPYGTERQGFLEENLEEMVDSLIISQSNGIMRIITFGEFTRRSTEPIDEELFNDMLDLFRGIHLTRKPVLMRILIVQACLYRGFQKIYRDHSLTDVKPETFQIPEYEWNVWSGNWTDAEKRGHLEATKNYLTTTLRPVFELSNKM